MHQVPATAPATSSSRPRELRASIENSLRSLRTDFVDVFYLHGIAPDAYAEVCERFLPELTAARDAG